MRQMASTGWITTTNGAFLEMAFQNVASREGITAKYAHVRSISGICSRLDLLDTGKLLKLTSKKMALQVFRM